MTGSAIRVLCVDDNPFVLDALRVKLRIEPGFECLDPLATADGLASQVRALRPSVVVLDLDMPGLDPLDALNEVADIRPETRVVMYTGHVRAELVDRAVELGAWGYVSKNDSADVLLDAIRSVNRGEFFLGPDVRAVFERRS